MQLTHVCSFARVDQSLGFPLELGEAGHQQRPDLKSPVTSPFFVYAFRPCTQPMVATTKKRPREHLARRAHLYMTRLLKREHLARTHLYITRLLNDLNRHSRPT